MPILDPYSSYAGPTGFPNAVCTPTAFPAPSFALCPEGYVAHEGEIAEIYISPALWDATTKKFKATAVPLSWTVSANYAIAGITTLKGFGDKGLREAVTVPLPRNQIKTIKGKHALNFDYTDLSIANYELIRAIQGTQLVAMWYVTIDGYVFGGAEGIIARIANAGHSHSKGENALLTGQVAFAWDNLFDPPAAELDPAGPLTFGKVEQPAPLKAKPAEAKPVAVNA